MDGWIDRQIERQVDENSNNNFASLKQLNNLKSIPPSKIKYAEKCIEGEKKLLLQEKKTFRKLEDRFQHNISNISEKDSSHTMLCSANSKRIGPQLS